MGVHLVGVHLTDVHLMGVHLTGVRLIGVAMRKRRWCHLGGSEVCGCDIPVVRNRGFAHSFAGKSWVSKDEGPY